MKRRDALILGPILLLYVFWIGTVVGRHLEAKLHWSKCPAAPAQAFCVSYIDAFGNESPCYSMPPREVIAGARGFKYYGSAK